MYFKLALKNVRKSYRDYLIYFLTLALSVCLFYVFNSFQASTAVMDLNERAAEMLNMMSVLMGVLSFFVVIVFAFLILYANQFLIKRRKKEFGIYSLLGMENHKISKILVYETLCIGVLSLIFGLIAGVVLSQLMSAITAQLFMVGFSYHFVISKVSLVVTVVCFSAIFIIVMLFNDRNIRKLQLIELLQASHKQEKIRLKKLWVSVVLFILSLLCIGLAYFFAMNVQLFVGFFRETLILGMVGTFLFFISLSGFLLRFIQTNKSIYLKGLNMFSLKQVHAKLSSTSISVSIVCLMLLLSIGALATGLNMSQSFNRDIALSTPYDMSYFVYRDVDDSRVFDENWVKDWLQEDPDIEGVSLIHTYDMIINIDDLSTFLEGDELALFGQNARLNVVEVSEYNQAMRLIGKDEITLQKGQGYLFAGLDVAVSAAESIVEHHAKFDVLGEIVEVMDEPVVLQRLSTSPNLSSGMYLVVNDGILKKAKSLIYVYNAEVKEGVDLNTVDLRYDERLKQYNEESPDDYLYLSNSFTTSDAVKENSIGLSVTVTYVGIYLGMVFILACAAILALQQLSEASDNVSRYQLLKKLGASHEMINRAVFFQVGLYFLVPLLLALVHSVVGIHAVSNVLSIFGQGNNFTSILFGAGIITLLYGCYFMLTYFNYCKILNNKE